MSGTLVISFIISLGLLGTFLHLEHRCWFLMCATKGGLNVMKDLTVFLGSAHGVHWGRNLPQRVCVSYLKKTETKSLTVWCSARSDVCFCQSICTMDTSDLIKAGLVHDYVTLLDWSVHIFDLYFVKNIENVIPKRTCENGPSVSDHTWERSAFHSHLETNQWNFVQKSHD